MYTYLFAIRTYCYCKVPPSFVLLNIKTFAICININVLRAVGAQHTFKNICINVVSVYNKMYFYIFHVSRLKCTFLTATDAIFVSNTKSYIFYKNTIFTYIHAFNSFPISLYLAYTNRYNTKNTKHLMSHPSSQLLRGVISITLVHEMDIYKSSSGNKVSIARRSALSTPSVRFRQ